MTYDELESWVRQNGDKKYKEFTSSLSGTSLLFYGVRLPILRKKVKELKSDSELVFPTIYLNKSFEINYLYIMSNIAKRHSFEEQLNYIILNKKYLKCWQITDSIPSYLKKAKFNLFFKYFKKNINSSDEFLVREMWIIALKYTSFDEVLVLLDYIVNTDKYYIMMAEAWFLATLAIYQKDAVKHLLENNQIDKELKKKAIQKIIDSFRIDDKYKTDCQLIRSKL